MEFFNFVETFFFISLAITFVLIMMLVYHFKERLSIIEKKTSTMFDIINNIVNQLNFIKNSSFNVPIPVPEIPTSTIPISNIFSQLSDKIVVSENESEYDSDEYESDEESVENEKEKDTVKRINIDLNTVINGHEEFIEDDEEDIDEETIEEVIEVVKQDETIEDEEDIEDIETIEEVIEVVKQDETIEDVEINDIKEINEYDEITDFEMYANMDSENKEESNIMSKEELINSYRKMDINALRTLVITKGLASDTRKLKKMDLIKLLDPTA